MRGLDEPDVGERVAEVLDERLIFQAHWPVAVALSGGGDSMALLLATIAWSRKRGRSLLAITVDHRLQAASADWTRRCGEVAARRGADFRAVAWEGEKQRTGVSAAARAARHRLLADAAREAGARVILLGHTADDIAEARAMRAEGSTTPDPRPWGPSPAWPEGRGLFLLRPMLGLSRAAIRDWLAARGESWIDDPANDDLRHARSRARKRLSEQPAPVTASLSPPDVTALAEASRGDLAGTLALPRAVLRQADPRTAARFVAIACLCAAGGSKPPRTDRLTRLVEVLRGSRAMTATLAGAKVEADADVVRFMREMGRDGLAWLLIRAGETAVWDGRFEVTTRHDLKLGPLLGDARRLDRPSRDRLKSVAPGARGALPAVVTGEGIACPVLSPVDGIGMTTLVHTRLLAAAGAVEREPG